MVNFTTEQIRSLMDSQDNIRNMSVIAHVDAGKSTLTDSLLEAAGIIAKAAAGEARAMQLRKDEQQRGITIKSSAISLYFEMKNEELLSAEEKAEEEVLLGRKKVENVKRITAEEAARIRAQGAASLVEDSSSSSSSSSSAPQQTEEGNGENAPSSSPDSSSSAGVELSDGTRAHVIDRSTKTPFLINLIDSPGHVDFSSEVTAALRVTDGALVVVDCIEGVCVQTETVLRQAISERIRPILFINKLDRLFLELQMDLEQAYQVFSRAVETINVTIATYKDDLLGEVQVYPERGTVGFGSGYQAWGFTIQRFAEMYATKFGVTRSKMMKRLWGENFFSQETKKWSSQSTAKMGAPSDRGFCVYILQPIETVFRSVMAGKREIYEPLLEKLGVVIPKNPKDKQGKDLVGKGLVKLVMSTWLSCGQALLQMIVNHLPSPATAQRYRVENLYSGPLDDPVANGIRSCDPNAPLCMYVSKMVPEPSGKGRFYAFGRVFSGTIATGQMVRIQGPDYQVGKKTDLFVKKVQRTVLMMGKSIEALQDCPCGNIIGLVGMDAYLSKSGTITDYAEAHNIVTMKFSVSPVVRVSVNVVSQGDLPKLMEGLKKLSQTDQLVQCFTTASGEHVIAGAGELHVEICIKDLREDYCRGAEIKVGQPVVSFCESISSVSSQTVMAKAPNKHNRISITASPLNEELCLAIEKGDISTETNQQETKVRAKLLAETWPEEWNVMDARSIWAFGLPPDSKANVLVDQTKGVAYVSECRDSFISGFGQATLAGCLADEVMRGCRFNVVDVLLHSDSAHRGANQVSPPTRRAIFAAELVSSPVLMEPMYVCDITVPSNAVAGCYEVLNARRGKIEGQESHAGTPLVKIKAYLPVLESFGFTAKLHEKTGGQAFPQLLFSHWAAMQGNPLEEGSMPYKHIMATRQRKGLKPTLPLLSEFHDKL